jgi:hypothetical protein
MKWNWIAMVAPVLGCLACLVVSGARPQGSELAGGLGALFRGCVAMAAICAIGAGAAILGMFRNEGPGWLGVAMLVLNLILLLPGVWVLLRMDWD